ncbi:MAG TPA: LuxR C-terminal-related transcriptional regulator [Burkholderiaceae bacterium]|nr:LuxR C-terminal-related transcriptional regulator [Burkholderiaceae bacterium]
MLERLFDLTPAERRVFGLLLADRSPREIAGELRIAVTTVRTHLQSLFAKTGTRRQSELVALARPKSPAGRRFAMVAKFLPRHGRRHGRPPNRD